jgi:hypothetical protein
LPKSLFSLFIPKADCNRRSKPHYFRPRHCHKLTPVFDDIDESEEEFEEEDERNRTHDEDRYHQSRQAAVLDAYQSKRKAGVPEQKLEDIHQFDLPETDDYLLTDQKTNGFGFPHFDDSDFLAHQWVY